MNAIKQSDNNQTPVLVVGLGKTGWSVVRFLCAQGKQVVVTDSRDIPPYLSAMREQFPEAVFIPAMKQEAFHNYQQVVVSPGIAIQSDHAVGDIELFLRAALAPVIAITGSNGKSTVTMLVTEMLNAGGCAALAGGNIGTPALDLLSQPTPDFYVLELSSFQLETTFSLHAATAVVLNISEDHMDRYDDLEDYAAAKRKIYRNARACVVNRHDVLAAADTDDDRNTVSFGLDQPACRQFGVIVKDGVRYLAEGDFALAAVSDITMSGEQNVQNVLAALALIRSAGCAISTPMIKAALAYPGLPHRCETVSQWKQAVWVNDSKGTNVGATLAAISGAGKPLLLIAGGQGKGADFSELGEAIRRHCKQVILIGEDAVAIDRAVDQNSLVEHAGSLQQAVDIAAGLVQPGDTVLFSPACASFDMFNSYEHRGDCFRQLVGDCAREEVDAG